MPLFDSIPNLTVTPYIAACDILLMGTMWNLDMGPMSTWSHQPSSLVAWTLEDTSSGKARLCLFGALQESLDPYPNISCLLSVVFFIIYIYIVFNISNFIHATTFILHEVKYELF